MVGWSCDILCRDRLSFGSKWYHIRNTVPYFYWMVQDSNTTEYSILRTLHTHTKKEIILLIFSRFFICRNYFRTMLYRVKSFHLSGTVQLGCFYGQKTLTLWIKTLYLLSILDETQAEPVTLNCESLNSRELFRKLGINRKQSNVYCSSIQLHL